MPYDNPKQAVAIFLDIKRKKGLKKAKEFGRKHREDFKGAGRRTREYVPRGRR